MKFFTFFLFFSYTNLSLALGLGEIDLKSNLGEPFSANVTITDIDLPPEAGCFSAADAGDTSAFTKAFISVKQTNGTYLLHITTKNAITEPIVNLRISGHCDPQINRDYLLLLDPAGIPTAVNPVADTQSPTAFPLGEAQKKEQVAKSASSPTAEESNKQATIAIASEQVIKKKKPRKKMRVAPSANQKLTEAYTGKQPVNSNSLPTLESSAANQPAENPANTAKPFLIISGGNTNTNNGNSAKSGLSLRLETQLDLARVEAATLPLSTIETLDEVTVVTNRLAHLEKQLVSLQARNAQLLADVEKAKNQGPNWLQISLIALGLFAVLAIAEKLRRRNSKFRTGEETAWFDADADAKSIISDNATILPAVNRIEPAPFVDSSNLFSQNTGFANTNTFAEQKDESGSVIEHADVFIEHGRPTLAIQLLQNHLSDFPTESPAVWLKLLKLLAKNGSEADYEDAVTECNKHYNIKVRSFAEAALEDISSIEDHPEIVTRIEGVWGSQYAVDFLNDLIYNKRAQPREGFEHDTFEELFFLKQLAEILQLSSQSNNSPTAYSSNISTPPLKPSTFTQALPTATAPLNHDDIFNAATSGERNRAGGNTIAQYKFTEEFEAAKKIAAVSLDGPPDPSYEVNMLFDDEIPNIELNDIAANQTNAKALTEEKFEAKEIDFSLPDAITPIDPPFNSFLNEEILLGTDDAFQDIAPRLQQANTEADSVEKPKPAKQGTKSISNLIEWDLPKLDLDKD